MSCRGVAERASIPRLLTVRLKHEMAASGYENVASTRSVIARLMVRRSSGLSLRRFRRDTMMTARLPRAATTTARRSGNQNLIVEIFRGLSPMPMAENHKGDRLYMSIVQ